MIFFFSIQIQNQNTPFDNLSNKNVSYFLNLA
jgi:hypothetical protein